MTTDESEIAETEYYTAHVATGHDLDAGPWLRYKGRRLTVESMRIAHGEGGIWTDQVVVDDLGEVGAAKLRAADVEDAYAEALSLAAQHGWRVMARRPSSYRDSESRRLVQGPALGSPMLPFFKDTAVIDLDASTNPAVAQLRQVRRDFEETVGAVRKEPLDLNEGQTYGVLCTPVDGDQFDFIDKYQDRDGNTLIFRSHRINLDIMQHVQITQYRRGVTA